MCDKCRCAEFQTPGLRIHWHRLDVDQTRAWEQTDSWGQYRLLLDPASGVQEALAEKRATIADRVKRAVEILSEGWTDEAGVFHPSSPDTHWLIWHHLEAERKAIEQAIPEAVSVYGSQDLETREERILGFSEGKFPILSTKPEIAGSGCNFQQYCHSNVFLGISYQFHDILQALHRTDRFQQTEIVDAHFIYAESEQEIVNEFLRKWHQHNEQGKKLREIAKKYGLVNEALQQDLKRSIGGERVEVKGERFTAVNNDCVPELFNLPDNTFDMLLTSIPFGNHYEYSIRYEDFGHNPSDARFWEQMDFLIPQALRVLKPGRVFPVHVKDRILYSHQTSGFMEVSPFSDECVMAFQKHGWIYGGRRTIVTDVVRENASTYRLGWSEVCKDSTKMGSRFT